MGYLVIKGEETHYNVTLQPLVTQHGYRAFRFIGDTIPVTDKGFMFYADNGSLISDLSEFTHYYAPNEYSMEEDTMVMPKGSDASIGPSPLDNLNTKVNRLSNQVNEITPYQATENAYVYTDHVIFNNVPAGVPVVTMLDADGNSVPFEVEEDTAHNRIIVKYEKREKLAIVNLTIQ